MSKFEKLTILGAKYVQETEARGVLHVETPHALIQAAGYLKHTAEPFERVLFRGQRALFDSLTPSLYRGIKTGAAQNTKHAKIAEVVASFKSKAGIFEKIPDYAHEPLLQHYGVHTTWADVVDNVWVALWFALYRAHSVGKNSEFLHFEQRRPSSSEQFGYILLIAVDEDRKAAARKGMVVGKRTELVDLRIAAPSIFLRPHAQHGLLFRMKANKEGRPLDYSDAIRGIIRFDIAAASNWLGSGEMHNVRSLFPPPYFDGGYRILLDSALEDKSIGCIHHIGA